MIVRLLSMAIPTLRTCSTPRSPALAAGCDVWRNLRFNIFQQVNPAAA
jgi:hypothetical protein